MKLLVLVTNARHCQGHFHLWGLSLPHSCVIADVTSMSLVSPKTHIVKLWNCSMQKAVSSAICMKWPLHRRRWDRSHRWTKSFDLERLWRMSTTTTLIYKISCNTMQRRFKSCSITIHVMIPPFSISAMWFNDSRSEWRLAPFGVSLSASLHGLHCGYTVATLLHTWCKSQLLCREKVCVRVCVCQAHSRIRQFHHKLPESPWSKGFIHFMSWKFLRSRIWPRCVSISVKYSWMAIYLTCCSFLWKSFAKRHAM